VQQATSKRTVDASLHCKGTFKMLSCAAKTSRPKPCTPNHPWLKRLFQQMKKWKN